MLFQNLHRTTHKPGSYDELSWESFDRAKSTTRNAESNPYCTPSRVLELKHGSNFPEDKEHNTETPTLTESAQQSALISEVSMITKITQQPVQLPEILEPAKRTQLSVMTQNIADILALTMSNNTTTAMAKSPRFLRNTTNT